MKVLLVGDTHCNGKFARNVCEYATTHDIDTIVQLGDFGFHFDKGFIRKWKDWLNDDPNREVYWLDGNHDDHDYIDAEITENGDAYEGVPISHWHSRMFYCPRGSRKTFGDTTVMFMGGAYSIDKHYRRPHLSWWYQEMLTETDVYNAGTEHVDVVFSHDCPDTIWFKDKLEQDYYKIDEDSQRNRDILTSICDTVSPRRVYHGHYHEHYVVEDKVHGRVVTGLSCDSTYSGHAVEDANVLTVEF